VPSPLNVSIGNYSRYYGYSDPTYIGTVTGIKQGDDVQVSFQSNSSLASPIGTYPIIINLTGTDVSKYTITTTAGLLTINPAPLTVTANSYSISYGDFIPSLSGVINGLENGDTINVSYQTTASVSSNAGSYPIVPQVTASNILNNYNLVVRNGNLNVSKVNLTVIGANLNRAYGNVNPELSYNILGFVNNENITVIDTVPYGQTFAQSNSSVGTYPITYVGGKDNNYSFTYVNGSLVVTQANQTILIASQVANVYSGNTLGITALVSSGLSLTATSSDTSIIKVVNGLEILGVSNGITTIIITQNGNDNYQAATPVTITGISTSTGIVSPSVIGVIGSGTVVKNEPVTYSMPLKSGYTYLWVFTGQNLNWLNSDSTSNSIKVLFTPETTKGQMIGRMYDPQGNLVKSDSIPIEFDNDPNALVAAYLAQQLQPVQCPVVVTDCDSAYIQIYSFGSQLKNVTGCSNNGFGDYSAINKVDTLVMGTSYSLEVVCVNKKSSASYFGIWIDYSNDGSFADPDDFVRSSFNTDTVFQVNNIVIRNNTNYIGPRRMRVSMQTSGEFVQSQFCPAQGTVGETEDYLVYIKQEDALNAPGLITPNDDGKNDYFIINGINPKLDNKLLISDRWGRKVFEQTNYQNTWGGTDNNGKLLEDGTYFYFFTNGSVEIRGYVEIKANK
jgi:gliding motility-associated-like protein